MCQEYAFIDDLKKGAQTITIGTVDTDIIVLLAGLFYYLTKDYSTIKLCVSFGMGKKYQEICINTIVEKLRMHKSLALSGFHTFTGCDTIS